MTRSDGQRGTRRTGEPRHSRGLAELDGISAGTALPGDDVLRIVSTIPGSHPASTGLAVSADLGAIGGSAPQAFYDGGTHGDQAAGDGAFSYQATIAASTPMGTTFQLAATITDAQSRTGHATIPRRTSNDRLFDDGFELRP